MENSSKPSLPISESPDKAEQSHPVRLKDIAKLAGVHVASVSAVLSPTKGSSIRISPKTAERIRELAERLNYRPHFHAQIMRKGKTGLIGLIEFARSEIHSKRTQDLAEAIRKVGYDVLISSVIWHNTVNEKSGLRSAIDFILNARVEGAVLIAPTHHTPLSLVEELQKAGIPSVVFNGISFPNFPQVRSDVFQGMQDLTTHLLHSGHRKLLLTAGWGADDKGDRTSWTTRERVLGFQTAIEQRGGKVVHELQPWLHSFETDSITGIPQIEPSSRDLIAETVKGYQATRKILQMPKLPDVLICGNDRWAMGALRACHEKGLQVPVDIAVTGFAGEHDMQFLSPSLTTVDTLSNSSGAVAVELLLKIIKKKVPIQDDTIIKTPCDLIIRESCACHKPSRV